MLQYGKGNGLPETYRMMLAVSIAFLAHTLLMATFLFELPEAQYNPKTVRVQLVPQGATPTSDDSAGVSNSSKIATPFSVETLKSGAQASTPAITSLNHSRNLTDIDSSSAKIPANVSRDELGARPQTSRSADTQSSTPSITGGKKPLQENDQPADVTMKSEAPSEELDYIAQLARKIGIHGVMTKNLARRMEIEPQRKQGDIISVELELSLMANGALVGASVVNSSGNEELDQRAYKAALASSPYPEPPADETRTKRFRVTLKYKL